MAVVVVGGRVPLLMVPVVPLVVAVAKALATGSHLKPLTPSSKSSFAVKKVNLACY